MDSFELNKILGAVLGTLMFVMGVGFLAEAIYHPIENRGPGYALPEPEIAEGGGPAEAAPEVPLGILLASASADRGTAAARKCQSCHTFGEGEPAKQGPNLYHIVEAPKAHMDGFAYSDILLQQKAEGQIWSYENLNAFLTNPKAYAPGTKMNFAGVRSPEERADILAYLQTLSPDPVPFPPPEEAAPADEAAPAEDGAAPAEDGAAPAEETAPAEHAAPADEATPAAEDGAAPAEETAPAEDAAPADEATPAAEAAEGTAVPEEVVVPAEGEVVAPTAPESVVETPTETQSDTSVEGTPVQQTTTEAPATTTGQ